MPDAQLLTFYHNPRASRKGVSDMIACVVIFTVSIVIATFISFVAKAYERRRQIKTAVEISARSFRRAETDKRLKSLSAFDLPCGAKAVKFTRLESDKAVTTNFEFKNKSIREGDVFLYGCDMCEERSRCALAKCPFDPHRRRLLLEAVSEAVGKTDAEHGHEVGTRVLDDDLGIPALSMVDVILKVKGFVFNSDGDVVVSIPPFADLVNGSGNGNQQKDGTIPCLKKFQ